MTIKNISLGPMEVQFFAWTQLENRQQVQTGDLVESMSLSPKQEANLLYNLSSSGFIVKLWRGFYLVPEKIPSGGLWSPSPYLIINKYMENVKATRFYISGPAVFNKYRYSDQLSSWFTVYNDKISKKIYIRQYHLDFTKVVLSRLGAIKKMKSYMSDKGFVRAKIGSPEQVILDAVYDYKKYGTLPEVYNWIADSLKDKRVNPEKLANVAVKYGNIMSQKRVGWALDKLKTPKRITNPLQKKVSKAKSLTALNPKNKRGFINKKWGVIENVKLS